MIDINDLTGKVNNPEQTAASATIPESQKLSAKEFVEKVVMPIIELQEVSKTCVKGIRQGAATFLPDKDGIVTFATDSSLTLFTDAILDKTMVVIDGKVLLNLRAVETEGANPTYGQVEVYVSTSPVGSATWSEKGSFPLTSMAVGATSYQSVDISRFLSQGAQSVRLTAKGLTTQKTATIVFTNITLATMSLQFANAWNEHQSGEQLNLSYYIKGAISKRLYITVDGFAAVEGTFLGTQEYIETPYNVSITEGRIMSVTDRRILTDGVHVVRAKLVSVDDDTKASEEVVSRVYYTTGADSQTRVVVNELVTDAEPYVDTLLFKYCIFDSREQVPFIVRAYNADKSKVYLEQNLGSVPTGQILEYRNSFDVTETDAIIPVYLYFYTLEDGREVPLKIDEQNEYAFISLDNSSNFSPVAMNEDGFILNPRVRSNSEPAEQRNTIINDRTGRTVPATFSGFDFINDGWVDSALRVPAGRRVRIGFDAFASLASQSSTASVTLDFDVRIYNLRSYEAESESVLTIGSILPSDGNILGWRMLPLRAHLLTNNKRAVASQDIQWQEDERTHITVNIVNNLANSGLNYVRIFINARIQREFTYANDTFKNAQDLGEMIIGSDGADIDIYNLFVFKQALSSRDIEQNHKAMLPLAADKKRFAEANKILGDGGLISFSEVQKHGYNTLRIIADDESKNPVPNYRNQGSNVTKGTVEMMVYNADGTPNARYCQRITHCKQKGQGTSSMTYWKWNITFTATADSERYTYENGNWVLDTSVSREDCYFIFPNGKSGKADIKGVKNVAKLNWASSMQSHKKGWCDLYTDMYWRVCGQSAINKVSGYENARKSVTQLPFLFFTSNSAGDTFYSVMTFGPGKYDKLCFGTKAASDNYKVNENGTLKSKSMFTALEGSSNVVPLPRRMVPWLTDEVFYYLNLSNDDDKKNETLVYAGDSNLDVDKAPMDVYNEGEENEYEIPKGFTPVAGQPNLWQETVDTEFAPSAPYRTNGNTIKFFRRAFNFDYLHSHRLRYYNGSATALRANASELDITYQYWVTQSDNRNQRYDLFRYDYISKSWVNAAAEKDADGEYAHLNLMTQCSPWFAEHNISYREDDVVNMNEMFIFARCLDYRKNSKLYYNEDDWNYDQAFRKFAALKDNWCKNTYESLQPDGRISCDSDDNDTSGDIDNVGASKCPYFVEEHDHCDINGDWNPSGISTYFNAEDNVRLCLRERVFATELRNTMQAFMNAMMADYGDVMKCLDAYFFDAVQRYFPAVVYNELARLLYEEAARAMSADNSQNKFDRYDTTVDPLSQSLGDHLQSELEFWKKRVAYIGSWCQYNGYTSPSGTFSFRSSGEGSQYKFSLKAHQAVYPAMAVDGVVSSAFDTPHRMLPGETYVTPPVSVNQDIGVFLLGIDYYASIGDLSGMVIVGSSGSSINVSGRRLSEFIADGADGKFAPSGLVFNTPCLQTVKVTNVSALTSSINLASSINLRDVNLQGTRVPSVSLPSTAALTSIRLGEYVTSLTINGCPSLSTLTLQGMRYVSSISIKGVKAFNSLSFVNALAQAKAEPNAEILTSFVFDGVSWGSKASGTGVTASLMTWLCSVPSVSLIGTGNIVGDVNADLKQMMVAKFGNVDSPDNSIYFTYSVHNYTNAEIDGAVAIRKDGTYAYKLKFTPATANNFVGVKWSISENNYAVIDERTGVLSTIQTPPVEAIEKPKATITATILLGNGSQGKVTKDIYLFNRIPKVGDFAYANGEFDDVLYVGQTIVGWVFRVIDNGDGTYKCFVQSAKDLNIVSTNGTAYTTIPWGIQSGNGTNYVPASLITEIAGWLGITSAEVTDLQSLGNFNSTGLKDTGTSTNYNSIKDYNAYDPNQADGFMVPNAAGAASRWDGKTDTNNIIAHAKRIIEKALDNIYVGDKSLMEYLGWEDYFPHNIQELGDLLVALKAANANANLSLLAYPAAYGCGLYEPSASDLHEQYKAGNWYLPSEGELVRLYIFYRNSRAASPADTGTPTSAFNDLDSPRAQEALRPWYANFMKKADEKGITVPISLPSTQANHWSSTENNASYAWNVRFSDGTVYNLNYTKYNSLVVRPVAAFNFEL